MRGEGFKTFQNLRGTICAPPDILRTMKSRELQVTAVKTLAVRVKKKHSASEANRYARNQNTATVSRRSCHFLLPERSRLPPLALVVLQ